MFYFLGIDIGGGDNTWVVVLVEDPTEKGKLSLSLNHFEGESAGRVSLKDIILFVRSHKVLTVTMDTPLSFSLGLKKGWRKGDLALKDLLPKEAKRWVLSYNALMGIPIRGYLLAQALSPYCGTILESHPRASLHMILPEDKKYLSHKYKREHLQESECLFLKGFFAEIFGLDIALELLTNSGFIDALLCAVTGFYLCREPEKLIFLPPEEEALGFGPFVIFKEKSQDF
ncbi:MAG: DUF429 domain-containing protein [Caldimicrobium sp.]|nr:DUF429 domain-containing protein [Caldimicrobium sp.]MCX7613766.1 DUF429 domain-containing protein [Caldimicrobium sp.]MDW8182593.1 DUF429 domain-containing protein [Caldimicrobium sp.]